MELECCIHHDSVSETKLVELSSLESWKKLLAAANIRNSQTLLDIASKTQDGHYPKLKYHKSCRSLFVNEKCLKRLQNTNSESSKKRSSVRLSTDAEKRECSKLPRQCIFCSKVKYIPKTRKQEKLLSYMETRADEKIRKYSKEKNDQRIMALCSDELIAKEAMYHKTCYRNYTREEYVKKDHYDVFEFVKQFLDKLSTDQKIIMYSELTDAVGVEMKNEGMPDEKIMNTKKNLRQRIEQNLI